MADFISGDNKYAFGKRTIILPVDIKDLPKEINAEGYTLSVKSSFHISLVCIGKIIEKYNVSIPDFENKVIADFCEFTKENDISLIEYRDEFKFVAENERRAVVVMCDVSNLDKFFKLFNEKYRLSVEVSPTHVTLYTLQPDVGIFITNSEDIKRLTKPIPNPIGIKL